MLSLTTYMLFFFDIAQRQENKVKISGINGHVSVPVAAKLSTMLLLFYLRRIG